MPNRWHAAQSAAALRRVRSRDPSENLILRLKQYGDPMPTLRKPGRLRLLVSRHFKRRANVSDLHATASAPVFKQQFSRRVDSAPSPLIIAVMH
jgi:hypothetical protein